MNSKSPNLAIGLGLAVILFIVCPVKTRAQERGHYLPGVYGLDCCVENPPGYFLIYLPMFYGTKAIKGPHGEDLIKLNGTVNFQVHNFILMAVPKKKIFGATYSASIDLPLVNAVIEPSRFPASFNSHNLTDLYIEPLNLTWHHDRYDLRTVYGFYPPTGKFDPNKVDNFGLGFWSHQFQAGTTARLSADHTWNASLLGTFETHTTKKGIDIRPGNDLTLEYGFGKRLFENRVNVGMAGYMEFQVSDDSGSRAILKSVHDRTFATGPEVSAEVTKMKIPVWFRYLPEYGVHARTSGHMLVFGIAVGKLSKK
jgi:hypothetical protein